MQEICTHAGISMERYTSLLQTIQPLSMEGPLATNDEGATLANIVADTVNLEKEVETKIYKEKVQVWSYGRRRKDPC